MIAPTPFFADRGCHVRIYEETRVLRKRGHDVVICTYPHGGDIEGWDIRRVWRIPWYNKLSAGPSWWQIVLDFLLFLKCLRLSYAEKFDVIHAHLHEGALIGMMVNLLNFRRIPLVFDYQGSLTGEIMAHSFIRKRRRLYWLFKFVEDVVDEKADVIISSSAWAAECLKDKSQINPDKVFVVRDGVNVEEFKPAGADVNLRKKLRIPDGRSIVVYLGVLSEYQGIDLLLEAAPMVLEKQDKTHFLIAGYPNLRYYKEMADKVGVLGNVTFAGRVDYRKEAVKYLCLGDVAVSPKISKAESNGKLYDYMACGLPTVVFDTPVNREILGNLGVYADFKDAGSLADKIIFLLEDKKARAELGRKLRETAVRGYSWENTGNKILGVYNTLMGGHSRL